MKIGLDVAKKLGVAYLVAPNQILTTVYEGSQLEQVSWLLDVLGSFKGHEFFVEKLNSFVNANTTRSLLLRTGYIQGKILEAGGTVTYVSAPSARKLQGVKDKKGMNALVPNLTNDEADAVAVLLFGLDGKVADFEINRMGV